MRSSLELTENLSKRENKSKEEAKKMNDIPKKEVVAKQTTVETPELIQKKRVSPFFEDLEKTSVSLSNDISLVLAMEIDDLHTH